MNCEECKADVSCIEHGVNNLKDVKDPDDFPMIVCYDCVEKYGSAFGSIVHYCSDVIGAFGGKEQEGQNGDGRLLLPEKRETTLDLSEVIEKLSKLPKQKAN